MQPAHIRLKNELEGFIFETNQKEKFIVIEVINKEKVLIEFYDRFNTRIYVRSANIRNGSIRNPNKITVCNIGYYGIGEFSKAKHLTYYQHWHNMLYRCYNNDSLAKYPSYYQCFVCDEWLCFQNFARWAHEQNLAGYLKPGWCLDKDIIVKNNKEYSPNNCCFVPPDLNGLLVKSIKENPNGLGVTQNDNGKYIAQCMVNNKFKNLGYFDTADEAFLKYKEAKESEIKRNAEIYKDVIEPRVYNALINYEITKKNKYTI